MVVGRQFQRMVRLKIFTAGASIFDRYRHPSEYFSSRLSCLNNILIDIVSLLF